MRQVSGVTANDTEGSETAEAKREIIEEVRGKQSGEK
jgi:hypothetical protein